MVGVIGHIANPTLMENTELAVAAESAGASWIGFADAFWWRDVWMTLGAVAAATSTIEIGPAMTNPYMRHDFHTISALATLQELAPGRTFAGITAGGSEVSAAAGISRSDAPARVSTLVASLRSCAAGDPLDSRSGRSLDVPLAPVPVLIAGRGDAMLRSAGRLADRVLVWAIPDSDLDRTVGVILGAAAERATPPELIWAPLVQHRPELRDKIMHVAVYATLNTRAEIRDRWGLDDALVATIRNHLVAGDLESAKALVPEVAVADVLASTDPTVIADRARSLGCSSIAVPGYSVNDVTDHVAWALRVESSL